MKKKNLKGMTLVEIIIAMAVLAIMSTVVVTTVAGINKAKVSTNALNKKVNYEAPIADSMSTTFADETTDQKIILSYGGTYEVKGSLYEVQEEAGFSNYGDGLISVQGNHNFKFFKANP
jgi:prepilin-type N-terminal cleavage/methylation domain-containing protein